MNIVCYAQRTCLSNEIEKQIEARNLDYFSEQVKKMKEYGENHHHFDVFSQADLDFAFHYCCAFGVEFSFTQHFIEWGAGDLINACIKGACEYQHYDLLMPILLTYGKSHDINLLSDENFTIQRHVVAWAADETYWPLYQWMIENLPNHTRIIRPQVKYYEAYHAKPYSQVYNKLLHALFYSINSSRQTHSQTPLILPKALELLAKKKFPLTGYNVNHIKKNNMEHLFEGRLNPREHYNSLDQYKFAHHIYLLKPGAEIGENKKWLLYHGFEQEWNIPHKIGSALFQGFKALEDKRNNKIPSPEHDPLVILGQEEADFFESIEDKKSMNAFFMRYLDLGKIKLYSRLKKHFNQMDNREHDNHDNSTLIHHEEDSSPVKI
jgi:hypothetical protein